ncbi:kynureninase [Urechidicola vernalis]|uniref:Kynureninase n=1 Tax=Urechidicola vernalis TaxID=3075600 RepID=A0ABU2Y2F1_9FLAO|nr:kynureninase [Urechidicola sp. P050]MDT0552378.1 kynureninase [Urechidicola sp. P050]
MKLKNSLDFARNLDREDPLRRYREKFHIPTDNNDMPWLYFCGNSLGLQPKSTAENIQQELKDWANLGVEGHFEAKNPWMPYHEFLSDAMAKIVGAKPTEVVVMNTLTTNLHLAMVSFFETNENRTKIIIESDAFPSDRYAVESQLKFHNLNPDDHLLEWKPREGEELLNYEDLESLLDDHKDEVSLLLIGGVNYYTGQFFDLKRITELGHKHGAKVGIDLAHGVGNIQPELHASNVDFAVWCTYKYLNSGPGSLGGLFVHEKYAKNKELKRLTGWWGHNKDTRFNMRQPFDPIEGAEGWQLSNPPILSMAAIKASLAIFNEVGMVAIRKKSKDLTGYLEELVLELGENVIRIISPKNAEERGCQLSIQVKNANKELHKKLSNRNVITDWREPDVIRVAPVPLYNSFEDVFRFVQILKEEMNGY